MSKREIDLRHALPYRVHRGSVSYETPVPYAERETGADGPVRVVMQSGRVMDAIRWRQIGGVQTEVRR